MRNNNLLLFCSVSLVFYHLELEMICQESWDGVHHLMMTTLLLSFSSIWKELRLQSWTGDSPFCYTVNHLSSPASQISLLPLISAPPLFRGRTLISPLLFLPPPALIILP